MRRNNHIAFFGCYLITAFTVLFLCSTDALAAETTKNWRATFDLVMRWVNFVIIVFVLVKFGEKIEEANKLLKNSIARFEKIKKRIVEDGEKKKLQIIEDARQESMLLLTGTRQKIENQIVEARNLIRSELIESAIALAEQRLPEEITAVDEQNLIDHFMESTAGK
jgi:F-type H+-transporting ATPase subunit b